MIGKSRSFEEIMEVLKQGVTTIDIDDLDFYIWRELW